jgi:hypothetical protein
VCRKHESGKDETAHSTQTPTDCSRAFEEVVRGPHPKVKATEDARHVRVGALWTLVKEEDWI